MLQIEIFAASKTKMSIDNHRVSVAHSHSYIYIYIYIYMCVCVCVCVCVCIYTDYTFVICTHSLGIILSALITEISLQFIKANGF